MEQDPKTRQEKKGKKGKKDKNIYNQKAIRQYERIIMNKNHNNELKK